jgi:hypothetical protein
VIRVFPSRTQWTPTDDLAFIGEPPLFRPMDRTIPVRVSVTFTWHKPEAERIARAWSAFYDDVQIGGPAYGDAGDEFTPGLFLKNGCTITSRGCVKSCPWCVERTRPLRELSIKPGWIVQDSNLLACSEPHIRAVFDMLREQKRNVFFNGGLDKHFLKDWHRELFDSISIGELWFACDVTADLPWLERAGRILKGIPLRKRRCYTMIGYDAETLNDAERRIERVFELGNIRKRGARFVGSGVAPAAYMKPADLEVKIDSGFMPFCQLYRDDEGKKAAEAAA